MKKTIGMGGFTLAEVLITLGIIGVVAAMTMPTLINSTQGAQYKTAFKKSLTVLSQAVVMNIALNDYDLSQVIKGTNVNAADAGDPADPDDDVDATTVGGPQSLYDLFSNRLNIVRTADDSDFNATEGDSKAWIIATDTDAEDREAYTNLHGTTNDFPTFTVGGTWTSDATFLFMNDGITFIFDNEQANCAKQDINAGKPNDNYCYGFIDVNGQKAPNRVVQCDNGSKSEATITDNTSCNVSTPTDIYPIAMYDQSIVPATPAARAILYSK